MKQLLFFLLAIGPIIFVHELGHFAVAKAFGMRVLKFSLGFGKQLWGFRRGETEYRVAILPLGGYVKLSGEDEGEVTDDPRDFANRPRWQRVLVYLAGPAANAVFSIALVAVLFMVGIEVPSIGNIPPVVGTVVAGSPGEAAGLLPGDRVLAVRGRQVEGWQDVAIAILTSADKKLALEVEREGKTFPVELTPVRSKEIDYGDAGLLPKILPRFGRIEPDSPAAAAGFRPKDEVVAVDGRPMLGHRDFIAAIETSPGREVTIEIRREGRPLEIRVVPRDDGGKGKIGVGFAYEQRFPPLQAFAESVRFNYDVVRQTLSVIGMLFSGDVALKDAFQGPLRIAQESDAAAQRGAKEFFLLVALISISIGLLNLFPIPILDGGQIAVLLIEGLLRRDLPLAVKERIAQVGLALIVLLMVTVLWYDASKRWFGG